MSEKNISDDLNPKYVFSGTSNAVLVDLINGGDKVFELLHEALANRGLDLQGNWVGFDAAEELHVKAFGSRRSQED